MPAGRGSTCTISRRSPRLARRCRRRRAPNGRTCCPSLNTRVRHRDRCLLHYAPMQVETVKTAYRRYAGFYDALFGPVLQAGRKAVLEALKLRPGDRVLEVGVGTGLSLPMYP